MLITPPRSHPAALIILSPHNELGAGAYVRSCGEGCLLGALGWLGIACVLGDATCALVTLLLFCCFVQARGRGALLVDSTVGAGCLHWAGWRTVVTVMGVLW